MKHQLNAVRAVRLTEETNTLINVITDICENNNIKMNGDIVSGSLILRYPFEKVAHAQFKAEKIEKLTDLLLFAYFPTNRFGEQLKREQIKDIVKKVFD